MRKGYSHQDLPRDETKVRIYIDTLFNALNVGGTKLAIERGLISQDQADWIDSLWPGENKEPARASLFNDYKHRTGPWVIDAEQGNL